MLVNLQLKRLFGKRGILLVLGAVSVILACSALPAKADVGADGFTVLGAYDNSIVHKCEVVGVPHKGYEGVVCVDITTGTNSGNYWAKGAVEVYCQTVAGVTVQCENINEYGVFADGAGDVYTYGDYDNCESGTCPTGRDIIPEGAIGYNYANAASNCADNPDSGWAVWTVAYGGDIDITLPVSGDTVSLYNNFETSHYYVCPYTSDGDS